MSDRYRILRTSFPVHVKTANLDSLESHILIVQCLTANHLGLLERSVRRIADAASGPHLRHSEDQVEAALGRLRERGIVEWWPNLEIVAWWSVLEEQQPSGETSLVSYWKSARKLLSEKPAEVRALYALHYREELEQFRDDEASEVDDSSTSSSRQISLLPQETGIRNQESGTRRAGKRTKKRAKARRVTSRLVDDVFDLMAEACKAIGRRGPQRDCKTNRDMIERATKRESATIDDWRQIIAAQLESVRNQPEWHHTLRLSTITRPRRWASLRDAPDPGRRDNGPKHAPSSFDGADRSFGIGGGQ